MSDRKYRQQGYQDQERASRASRTTGPPVERDGPRGRGLGKPTRTTFRCRDCGTEVPEGEVTLADVCAHCGVALHSCVNCLHFDPSVRFECRQPIETAMRSKTRGNECTRFEPKRVSELGSGGSEKPGDARSAFDALFDL